MFQSGVSAAHLISGLKSEVDVAIEIKDDLYVSWLNSLEQLIYSEVVRELNSVNIRTASPVVSFANFPRDNLENVMRFEDIYMLYADGVQLTKTLPHSARLFSNVYYKSGTGFRFKKGYDEKGECDLEISYFVRPALKKITEGNIVGEVMLPYEFMDLARARLRMESYKIMNEDALSAKWANDYNILAESFKAWIASRRPLFGV